MKLLNVGCGTQFHADWTNLDLVSNDPRVTAHDLRLGIPFPDHSFDAVYHSHVLEHLEPEAGEQMLRECARVLKPSGTLRVVVPDLEAIVRLYLEQLERAASGDERSANQYDWVLLELIDQMVRKQSGGQMARMMVSPPNGMETFLVERLGDELERCRDTRSTAGKRKESRFSLSYVRRKANKLRHKLGVRALRLFVPDLNPSDLDEMRFRRSGELHRWMYDRFSLTRMFEKLGLEKVKVCGSRESRIEQFASYELDTKGDRARKPDSLFMEGMKVADGQLTNNKEHQQAA